MGYLPALDGVRGLAVLSVLLYHFVAQTESTNSFERVVNWALGYGLLGVDLFFILSGFLITGILYDARGEPDYFRNFYMRRVVRIFPLYYGVLAVVFFVVPLIPFFRDTDLGRLHEHQAWAWLYGVNIYLSLHGWGALSYLDHFWTLAVEEHFYFLWPLLVWLCRGRPATLLKLALGVALLSFAGRVAASAAGVSQITTVVLTPFQLDALCLGGFFAVYVRERGVGKVIKGALLPLVVAAGAVALLSFGIQHLMNVEPAGFQTVRRGMYRILLAGVLLWAFAAPASSVVSRFFRSGPMITLGKYSYGLYVYHHFLSYYFTTHRTEFELGRLVGSHTLAVAIQATVGITVSFAVAWASYEYFEKPFLKLKRYWPSAQERAAAGRA